MAAADLIDRRSEMLLQKHACARDAMCQLYYLHVAMMTSTRQNVHQPLKKGPCGVENPMRAGPRNNFICVA